MRIDEVIIQEISQAQKDAMKQMRDIHIQRRIQGVGTDTSTYGRDMGQAVGTDVEVGDLKNVPDKGTTDADVRGTSQKDQISKRAEPRKKDGPSDAELRAKARTAALKGTSRRGLNTKDGDSDGVRTGSDGRKLRHQKYYGNPAFDPDAEYDSVLPSFGIKKGLSKARNTVASYLRNPSDTMANLRYKFKDLLSGK